MTFSLATPTRLKIRNVSPRKEVHGETLVQAIDVDLDWTTSNEALGMFDPLLLGSLYDVDAAQTSLDGVAPAATALRLPDLDMPLKWTLELLGRDFRVIRGLGGKSDLVLSTARVKKFRLTANEGGTVVVGFQVQGNVDVGEKVVGKLCALEGEEIEATLTESEAADDEPVNTAGERDATDMFVAASS